MINIVQIHWNVSGQTSESWCQGFVSTKPPATPCRWWWESVPEKSGKLHILTRLSVRENMIEFCRRESFKSYLLRGLPNALSWYYAKFLTRWCRFEHLEQSCLEENSSPVHALKAYKGEWMSSSTHSQPWR